MSILTKYSIVCQVLGAESSTVCAYNGEDLSQVIGITQANLPTGHYGWIQECGEALVSVSGQTQPAYADFRPNAAKRDLKEGLSNTSGILVADPIPHEKNERLSLLPPLLMEYGPYCKLAREARDVFIDGHFYACVAMCGISFERFQRDRAAPYGATRKHKMDKIRSILRQNNVLKYETLELCKKMAKLRNDYAHGDGLDPKADALKSLEWMHSFMDNETSLMKDYLIVNGVLSRKVLQGQIE
jgi:hypothetical protein